MLPAISTFRSSLRVLLSAGLAVLWYLSSPFPPSPPPAILTLTIDPRIPSSMQPISLSTTACLLLYLSMSFARPPPVYLISLLLDVFLCRSLSFSISWRFVSFLPGVRRSMCWAWSPRASKRLARRASGPVTFRKVHRTRALTVDDNVARLYASALTQRGSKRVRRMSKHLGFDRGSLFVLRAACLLRKVVVALPPRHRRMFAYSRGMTKLWR